MKKLYLFVAIALGAMMTSCGCGGNDAAQNETKEELAGEASKEISAIKTAQELARYGYETESAAALIEAADIMVSTKSKDLTAEQMAGDSTVTEQSGEKASVVSFDTADLLAKAKEYANDDSLILAMAARVEARAAIKATADTSAGRGAYAGPEYAYNHRCPAYDYVYYNITFEGDRLAEVAVVGDGDTDLDLYVYDENGNLITSDTGYTDNCYVRFVPAWTGRFKVKIVNRGGVYNRYSLLTN